MARMLIAAALCLLAALPAGAQPRIVNGFAAGGTADILLRLVAERAAEVFGQRAVVENRTGANGFIGAEAVSRGATDGSVVGLCVMGMMSVAPELPGMRLPIDPRTDLAGVAMMALSPYGLVTGAQGPHRTLQDLLRAARARPSAVSYASTGVGSAPHLFGALIGLRAGAEMVHVPYRGGAPAVLDVVAGRADFLVVSLGDVSQQLRGGELRLLALGDERRLPGIPEAPTLGSAMPGLEAYSWFALCGPRGITAEGRGRWERVVQSAVADPAFRARVEQMGLVTLYEDGPAVERRIEADRRKWGEVVRAANIRAQ